MIQCALTIFNAVAGQTYPAATFAQNGTAPYTVTGVNPSGILTVTGSGDLQINAGTTPGSYTRNVTIQDANGDSVTCQITFNVSAATGGSCIANNMVQAGNLTPADFQTGATAFASNTSNIVQGQTGIQVNSVTSSQINISCTGTTNGSITVQMADGTNCSATVECAPTAGGCIANNTVQPGNLNPSDFQTGATAFNASLGDIVQGQTGINVTSVTTSQITIECTGTTNGSITVRMADGSDCTATVNCSGVVDVFNCAISSLNVAAGQSYPGSLFVTGGTAPYTVTAATAGILSVSAGNLLVSASAAPGTYTRNVTIQDSSNPAQSVTCQVTFTVTNDTTEPDCSGFTPITTTAGGSQTVSIFIDDGNGGPAAGSPTVTATSGSIANLTSTSAGNWDFEYTAPATGTSDTITVSWDQGGTTVSCTIDVTITTSTSDCVTFTPQGGGVYSVTATSSGTMQVQSPANASVTGLPIQNYVAGTAVTLTIPDGQGVVCIEVV